MKKTLRTWAVGLTVIPALIGVMAAVGTVQAADYLSPDAAPLSAKEKKAMGLTSEWSQGGAQPFMSNGRLTYVHGAGVTTIIATPFQVSDVELEAGEKVNEIVVGDSARWLVEQGEAGKSMHIFIKPLDNGLESSAVITTDRRVYHLRLISKRDGYTPYVGFVYSTDLRSQAEARAAKAKRDQEWNTTSSEDGTMYDLSALNFNYDVDGKAAWKPERVYDDGKKTYIQLPGSVKTGEMPVLLVKKGDKDVLVNYRVKGNTLQVDGLFPVIALVVGVGGDQESIEIRRNKS